MVDVTPVSPGPMAQAVPAGRPVNAAIIPASATLWQRLTMCLTFFINVLLFQVRSAVKEMDVLKVIGDIHPFISKYRPQAYLGPSVLPGSSVPLLLLGLLLPDGLPLFPGVGPLDPLPLGDWFPLELPPGPW